MVTLPACNCGVSSDSEGYVATVSTDYRYGRPGLVAGQVSRSEKASPYAEGSQSCVAI